MNLNIFGKLEGNHVWKINLLDLAQAHGRHHFRCVKRIHVTYFMDFKRLLKLYDDLWAVNCTSETHLSTIIIIENYFGRTKEEKNHHHALTWLFVCLFTFAVFFLLHFLVGLANAHFYICFGDP